MTKHTYGWFITVLVSCTLLSAMAGLPHGAGAEDQASPSPARAHARAEDAILGEWWTENNEGKIKFQKYADGTYRGITTCCKPKHPSSDSPTDINNPNPKLRERSTLGIVIIWKLVFEDGEYNGGYLYNPRDGKTYRFQVSVIDASTIKIRGYLGVPLLGQSQIWKRASPAR